MRIKRFWAVSAVVMLALLGVLAGLAFYGGIFGDLFEDARTAKLIQYTKDAQEPYEQSLREKHKKLLFAANVGDSKDKRAVFESLSTVSERLSQPQRAFNEHIRHVAATQDRLQQLEAEISQEEIQTALTSLARGESEAADELFARLEVGDDPDYRAKNYYARGAIAWRDLRLTDAYQHFANAAIEEPQEWRYEFWAGKAAMHTQNEQSAQKHLTNALTLSEQAHKAQPESDPGQIIESLNLIGQLYLRQQDYASAEPFLQRAVQMQEQHSAAENLPLAVSLDSLARIYYAQGSYDKAEPYWSRVLKIRRKELGRAHPNVAATLLDLANLYKEIAGQNPGRLEDAEKLMLNAVGIWQNSPGSESPTFANGLVSLASLYRMQGNFEKAEALIVRALQILQNSLSKDDPQIAGALNNLASIYQEQGAYEKAMPLYTRALMITKNSLGADNLSYALSANNLAELYRKLGEYKNAASLFEVALAILRKHYPGGHPHIRTIEANYAALQQEAAESKQEVKEN